VLGQPLHLHAKVVDRSIDKETPRREFLNLRFHRFNSIVALITDLVDVDELKIFLVMLQILEAILEVGP